MVGNGRYLPTGEFIFSPRPLAAPREARGRDGSVLVGDGLERAALLVEAAEFARNRIVAGGERFAHQGVGDLVVTRGGREVGAAGQVDQGFQAVAAPEVLPPLRRQFGVEPAGVVE